MICSINGDHYLYTLLQEYTSLGTAGGIYHFRDRILAGDPDSFFVMNGDVCAQFPLQEMVDFAAESVRTECFQEFETERYVQI